MLAGLASNVNGLSQKCDGLVKIVHGELVRDKASTMAACNATRTSDGIGQDDAGMIGGWHDALASVGSTRFTQTRAHVVMMQQNEAVSPSPEQPPLALSPHDTFVQGWNVHGYLQ
ncbi:unnamed protein product [Calypogeia fissa]